MKRSKKLYREERKNREGWRGLWRGIMMRHGIRSGQNIWQKSRRPNKGYKTKLLNGKKDREEAINRLPTGESKRENWKKLKENLKPPNTRNIRLRGNKGGTEDEGKIRDQIIGNF